MEDERLYDQLSHNYLINIVIL